MQRANRKGEIEGLAATLVVVWAIAGSAILRQQVSTRVLFVGNSLTAANDLPSRLRELSLADGDGWETSAIAYPNYSLEDHWQHGDATRAIADGHWTFVVLQQGPSALPESRALLVDFTRRFDSAIRAGGGRTALYMVWPAGSRRGDFPGVSQSYAAAAAAVSGLLLPVGDAWQAAWREDPRLPLYGDDGFHPSRLGTALGAIVIYEHLAGRVVRRVPSDWSLTAEQRALLLRAAARTR
ncbi:MAG TPA: hypothetical protein VF219_14925 [Vicinamibacterales bacterium]